MEKEEETEELIQELNQSFKKMDNIYYELAKNSGLSDTAFWIIYTIKNEKGAYQQKDLCIMCSYSKQTINSALKKLEEQDIIKLVTVPNNKKDKKIILTEYGEKIAKKFIEPVNVIERMALNKIKEKRQFVHLFKEYIEEMNQETNQFIKRQEEV